MLKNFLTFVLMPILALAACQIPSEVTGQNYADLFDYGQELMTSAKCYADENSIDTAATQYNKAIQNFETALTYLNLGTDFELRANAYKKMADTYSALAAIKPENGYDVKAEEYYSKAEIEMQRVPNYLVYIIIAIGVIIIIIIGVLMFGKKKYPDEYVQYKPAPPKKVEPKIENIVRPAKKEVQQTLEKVENIKDNVKEKYREKIRKKYGL